MAWPQSVPHRHRYWPEILTDVVLGLSVMELTFPAAADTVLCSALVDVFSSVLHVALVGLCDPEA